MDLVNLGSKPISESSPAGSEVRDSPQFEKLQTEIDKFANPAASSGTNWNEVVKLAAEILEKQGKDILVAAYLAVGLMQVQKIAGLATGLTMLSDLLTKYWDALYPPPKRMRGRRTAIEWWLDRTQEALRALEPEPVAPELLAAMKKNVDAMDALLRDKDAEAPSVFHLHAALDELPIVEPPRAAEAAPVAGKPAAPVPGSQSAPQPGAPPAAALEAGAPPQNQADADKTLDGALRRIGEVAGFLLDADLSNPLAYRLSRIALWSRIESLPQAAANKTRVPPPPAQVVSTLATMLDKGDRESLVKFAESRLPEFIFWLDLSRVTAEALDGLGSRFVVARNTVAHETASFVRRLAGIEGLTFSDGTPYANADTQNWLRGLLAGEAMGAVEPPGDGDDREGLTAALTEAGKQVEQGNWIEAAARLQSQLASGMSAKSRLMARIRFCQMMVAHKKVKDMRPFLKPLLEEIDRRDLDSWDPALALHALKVIYLGLAGAPSGDGDLPQANDILRRIALLDYAEALRLSGV